MSRSGCREHLGCQRIWKESILIGSAAFHYIGVVAGLYRPETQTTQAEREVLASFLPGAKRIVEIGVFEGFTTRMLAEHADADSIIYGIDPFFVGRLGICSVSYTHLTLPTTWSRCRSRWSPYH